MIVGISCSGRSSITDAGLKTILKGTSGSPTSYYSLQNKKILSCDGCAKCSTDFQCHIDDDWLEIGEAVRDSSGIVLGIPNYFGSANSLSHAFMERFFAFRHKNEIKLKGKKLVLLAVGGVDPEGALSLGKRWAQLHQLDLVTTVSLEGQVPCAMCGHGDKCDIGCFGTEGQVNKKCIITREMFTPIENQAEKFARLLAAGRDLSEALQSG